MARKTRTRSRGARATGRRGFLVKVGAGALAAGSLFLGLESTGAFGAVSSIRESDVQVASGSSALVGIVGQGPVKKNSRDAMIEFTNNTSEQLTIKVTLDTSSDGTLYDNDGGSGSSVTYTLNSGNSQFVDIDADVTGTIGYDVSVSTGSGFNLYTLGSVESESGNVKGAVRVQQPAKDQDFDADKSANEFVVDKVDIRDDDDDDDLDTIEFRVREGGSNGTIVGSFDENNPPGDRYNPNSVTITPDAGYTIKSGTTYGLTVTGRDADGNFDSETVEDTTSGPSPTPTDTATDTPTDTATDTPTDTATDTPTDTPTPSNQPPTADFTSSRKGNSQNVELDGSPSSDPDGSIVSYEWDVNADGSFEYTGQTIKEKISSGTDVRLRVTDNDGATGEVTKTIN